MTRAGLARRPLACDMLRGLRRISTKRRGVEVMAYTYEELKHKTVAELRDIAAGIEHEALQGYTQLNKEHLLHALARALGVEEHLHHDVVGINKTGIKSQIKT